MDKDKELEELKEKWQKDPCWDVEDTIGFEKYKEELKKFRFEYEKSKEKEYQKELSKKAKEIGIYNPNTIKYLISLENRIKELEEKLLYNYR